MTSANRLKSVRNAISTLKRIQAKMDPASGLTVTVKRGCDSEHDDDFHRDEITLQLGDCLDEIIDAVIKAAEASEKLNVAFCRQELLELQEVLS